MENLTSQEIGEITRKIRQIRRELLEKHPEMDARKADWMARRMLSLSH
jgi:hypothetical protein